MNNLSKQWFGVALFGALICVTVFLLCKRSAFVDFADNPAVLVDISTAGMVKLDTYQGQIVAPLSGVNWITNSAFLAEAQKLVREAQRDKVAFSRSKDGKLKIWFETESGAESLNEKLNQKLKGQL